MQREPINSSNLHSTGHDETGMEVQFHKKGCAASRVLSPGPCDCGGGDVHHFEGVPAELHERLRTSPSPGSFFSREIVKAKNPNLEKRYPGRKL